MKLWKVIGSLALAVPAVVLLAIGPRDKSKPVPDGVVVVEYWEKWTGDEGEALQASVDEFNNTVGKQKGIYVKCLSTSGITQKTLVATAGGVPPDVAGLWDPIIPQLASLDALESLDDLAAAHGITSETYKKVFWDLCRYNNKLYALVSTPYCYAMHYNTKIFADNAAKLRAAGLDPTRPPRTIDELDAYAKVLDERGPDGTLTRTGYLPTEPGWDNSYLPYYFGGDWWDNANHRFVFTDPKVVKTFDWMQSYARRLGPDAVSDFRTGLGTYESPQNAFLTGKTAIVSQGTFFARLIHHQTQGRMDGQWAAAPFPSAVPGLENVTSCTADVLVIPKGAKHPKEAFEFIAWLNQQKNMEKLCNEHCKISPLAKVSDEFLKHHNNPYIKVFEDLAASPNAHGTPPIETMTEVGDELGVFIPELMLQRTNAKDGLEVVQQRMQAKLDAFVNRQKLHEK
jgi:ABC-type glycerol-3-phosphate transport system substrate-binding protein